MYQFEKPGAQSSFMAAAPLALSVNSVVLDTALSTHNRVFRTVKVSGRDALKFNATAEEVPGRPGQYFRKEHPLSGLGVREITVLCYVQAKSEQVLDECKQELARLLIQDDGYGMRINFADRQDEYFEEVCLLSVEYDANFDLGLLSGFVTIQLVANNPVKYSWWRTSVAPLEYRGTQPTKLLKQTIIVQSSVSEVVLRHLQSKRYVRLVGTYLPNSRIEIDHQRKSITLNGRSDLGKLDYVNSRFFEISRGRNEFTVSNGTLTTQYREANL